MVRNEEPSGPIDREQLKKEIREELRDEERRRRRIHALIYVVLVLAVLSSPFVFLGVVAAKAGLADIPVLTSWLYSEPEPTRAVVPLSGYGSTDVMTAVVASADYNPITGLVELSMSEQQLTTVVAEIAESDVLDVDIDRVQVVLLDGELEIFAKPTVGDGRQTAVLVSTVPSVSSGIISLDSQVFRIGSLELPDSLADIVMATVADAIGDNLNQGLGAVGTLDKMEVEEGNVRVFLRPTQ